MLSINYAGDFENIHTNYKMSNTFPNVSWLINETLHRFQISISASNGSTDMTPRRP